MWTLPRGAALLVMGAALVGCVASSPHTNKSSNEQRAEAGKPASNISGADADGKKFQLSDYRGKVVLLDFWASY